MVQKRTPCDPNSPATLEIGPVDWQIVQQDGTQAARITLGGRWWTIFRRKRPEVRVRVAREGNLAAVSRALDWAVAQTAVDRSARGEWAGRRGTWRIAIDLPCGGPYRVETCVGSAEDAVEWRRRGDTVRFLGVGDVWLIAGQSNAEGNGRDPVDDPPEIGVHMFGPRRCWELAAHGASHSPWLAFAKTLRKELGYPIGLIPTAVGGSPVSRWDPGTKGDLFEAMRTRLEESGGGIRGCLWYQGESDVGADAYPKYKTRFARFARGLRRAAKRPRLPILTVQLNRVLGPRTDGAGWEAMREIQRQLSHAMDAVFLIPIFEAGLCDGIHISSQGNLLLARRAATVALGAVYGRDLEYRFPECVSARRVSAQTVDLRFDHVVERLDYEWAVGNAFPFSVRDRLGEVPIAGFQILRRNVFRLRLGRELAGAATVTGAPGTCPAPMLPRDIHGYRCMLGFTMEVAAVPGTALPPGSRGARGMAHSSTPAATPRDMRNGRATQSAAAELPRRGFDPSRGLQSAAPL